MISQTQAHLVSKYQLMLAFLCALALAVSLISPSYPRQQWLQHVPTGFGLLFLLASARHALVSNLSATCITVFVLLHILGARWIYSYVPYDDWMEAVLGTNTTEIFGWKRNHYDRFVHFAFGLLFTYPLTEACTKLWSLRWLPAILLAFNAIMAISAGYEVFEWLLAILAAPEFAERYNGQQGDFWDPQKDMALAGLGSAIVGLCLAMKVNASQTQNLRVEQKQEANDRK